MSLFKSTLSLIIIFGSTICFSQNETNNWYFGENAGLNFSNNNTSLLINGAMNTPAGCSSISDTNGDLLFYTNGQTVWNKNHQIMQNGTNLAGDINNTQTSIIIPKPNDNSRYYIFTTRENPSSTPLVTSGLFFSEIEISTQNPLGIVVLKNSRLTDNITERITAIHDAGTNSIKVIAFGSSKLNEPKDTFFVFNVTENGINRTPIKSQSRVIVSSIGAMKISPNGEKIVMADYDGNFIYLYDFNIINSLVSYDTAVNPNLIGSFLKPYGVEFSQDSKVLYFTGNYLVNLSCIYKYILNHPIYDSKILIASSTEVNFGSLQLARNGKIYVSTFSNTEPVNSINKLSVINKPEEINDDNSDFENLSLGLSPNASFKGLPNFVSSFLRNRIITENKCFNEPFEFTTDTYAPLDSVLWDFGDGSTSSEFEPLHQFNSSGKYLVKATISFNNQTNEIFKEVEAYPVPEITPNERLLECDTDNDGVILINLNNIKDKVLNYKRDFGFFFYRSYDDAVNELNAIENPETYSTSFDSNNLEEIFVKIITPEGCFTISNFFIEAIYNELENILPVYVCENSDFKLNNQEGRFDLEWKGEEIRAQFSIPQSSTIAFYASLLDAQTKTNALWKTYESKSSRIWVRVETDNNDCAGIGSFEIIVNDPIELDIEKTYTICAQEPSILLDGGDSNDSWEWLDNNGTIISTNQTVALSQPGTYSVTVYKNENGLVCPLTKNFTINPSKSVIFDEVKSGDNQIIVSVIGNSNYEYSIDGINYFGDGKIHTFNNISAGLYTVYVRDINNCESPITDETYFIGYPKFFTPNGDGYNDTWRIEGISEVFYLSADVFIFDRYGKVLHYMNLSSNKDGWNGLYNGQILSSDDYWFKATLIDIENNSFVKTGHFTLKI